MFADTRAVLRIHDATELYYCDRRERSNRRKGEDPGVSRNCRELRTMRTFR
jgi:hypothetical protein